MCKNVRERLKTNTHYYEIKFMLPSKAVTLVDFIWPFLQLKSHSGVSLVCFQKLHPAFRHRKNMFTLLLQAHNYLIYQFSRTFFIDFGYNSLTIFQFVGKIEQQKFFQIFYYCLLKIIIMLHMFTYLLHTIVFKVYYTNYAYVVFGFRLLLNYRGK